ncbi:MAG: hypothetical protein HY866_19250 [Chloroflexi bacterium]|nr:hypothetical protein [Chloroflexota bacterium]
MYIAKHFQPHSPDAQANGQVFMPYLEVLRGSKLEHLIKTYKLDELQAEVFYPQQAICDMQKQMSEEMGLFSGELVAIGVKSIDSIGFPAEVKTIEDAMGMLNQIYQMIHHNIPKEEGWIFEKVSDKTLKIFFNSPYEPFAAYGYIYGIANRFKPAGTSVSIYMEEEKDLTVYRVEFE